MDIPGVLTSRNVRTVSLVVTLIDDLTGRVITGSNARAWIESERPPIKKAEGWSVFLNLPEGEYTVFAEGGVYNKKACVCTIGKDGYTDLKIRLTPNRVYRLPGGTSVIRGKASPESAVIVYPTDKAAGYKLLSDVRKDDRSIGIFHPDNIDIEGKLFYIMGEDCSGEFLRVGAPLPELPEKKPEYKLWETAKASYQKIGTLVFPVSEAMADSSGEFFIPIAPITNMPEKGCVFVCESEQARVEITLGRGETQNVEFPKTAEDKK